MPTLKIIDVSEHQKKIDWEKVKPQIDGAILRTGYGDDISSQDDKYFKYNADECERLGIPYHTYLYSYAKNEKQIKSEIAHEKRLTKGRKCLFHWLDLEEWSNKDVGMKAAKMWLKEFENAGVYAGQAWWKYPLKGLECSKWIPAYPGKDNGTVQERFKPNINVVMDAWQYTSKGRINGINGNVDISLFYVPFVKNEQKQEQKKEEVERVVTKKEVAALILKHLVTHKGHGYTQDMDNRWGTGEETIYIYGHPYKIKDGDRDCSSAVISAYEAAGISCGGATYTGNMRPKMVATKNFEWLPMTYIAQMGDTYLNEKYHTAMCLSPNPDLLMEFSINEKGKALGGKIGDQKQVGDYDEKNNRGESHIRTYYSYPWNGILRCKNEEVAFTITETKTTQEDKKSVVIDMAIEVILGLHGNGEDRRKKLGDKYEAVQKEVNALLKDRDSLIKYMYDYVTKKNITGSSREELLGSFFSEVHSFRL